ncbi:MAG: anaerobic glycerol-3-phosphate dehydrogenase subunit A [Desulfomicrobium sp.]
MTTLATRVLIIGAGATGAGLLRDLALRGVQALLIEQRDVNSGASGGNHGLLHSGARYVASDREAAMECRAEGDILRRLAPQCIDDAGGLFVAVRGDDERYVSDFPGLCAKSGVPCRALELGTARAMEPALSQDIIAAFAVQDGAVDPFMLSLDNIAQGLSLGGSMRRNLAAVSMDVRHGRVGRVECRDMTTGEDVTIEAELVINASGAWAGLIAALAGTRIGILYSMGSLVITQDRIATRVINRLRPPSDADILVPGGTVSILGTTSIRVPSPEGCRPSVAETDRIIDDARAMLPILERTRYIRAYAGVRPLVSLGPAGDDRAVSRGFALIDHAADGVDNFLTITGGKLTTYRLMAEKAADLACAKLGVSALCRTRTEPLPPSSLGRWTEPGRGPKSWVESRAEDDIVLCECEMVSRSVIDAIVDEAKDMRGRSMLKAIGMRSRVGKGPCQGGFCGPRIAGHLYDREISTGTQGLAELKTFTERRWRGFSPILWGVPLMQADLQEALHCGAMDLEFGPPPSTTDEESENCRANRELP